MKKYALIGEKLGHSYSKLIHEKFFELCSMNAEYSLFEIAPEELEQSFKKLAADTYSGINVTIPYKRSVIDFLDNVSEEAKKIGAVNTVKFSENSAVGYNTDYYGFLRTLEKYEIEIKNKNVIILGTGGASKAVVAVCKDLNAADISFVSRSFQKKFDFKILSYKDDIKGDVLINTTPVGMYPNVEFSPIEKIDKSFNAVVDIIYNPYETKLMKQAIANGLKAVNGLYMLVAQAVYSEALWNDLTVDYNVIDKIYNDLKKNFSGVAK